MLLKLSIFIKMSKDSYYHNYYLIYFDCLLKIALFECENKNTLYNFCKLTKNGTQGEKFTHHQNVEESVFRSISIWYDGLFFNY